VARAQAVVKPDWGPIFAFRGRFARPSWGWSADFSVDARAKVVQLRRAQVAGFFSNMPPCLNGMAACASVHHLGACLRAPRAHNRDDLRAVAIQRTMDH